MSEAEVDLERRSEPAHYRLETLLGRGGMGEIYKAWDERHRRWVAVKHLLPRETRRSGEAAQARFRQEARAASQLRHRAIVEVFEVVEDDTGGDWIVMELIDGPTFYELLQDRPLEPARLLEYGQQVAAGLAAAHARGIVHRDLKTENVMLASGGQPKILDFGLAKLFTGVDGRPLTGTGQMLGTPRAMSPEQVREEALDARTDLFSLGVLLYEMATARSPFKARSRYETLTRVTTHRPPSVRELDPRLGVELSELIDRLLEKDPGQRPASAADVAAELARLRSDPPPAVAQAAAAEADRPPSDLPSPLALEEETELGLRRFPPPELPAQPYPVLLPYTHPALLAGRERELADLRRLLRMPSPILGLCAPSGAGKSSLILGALVPTLRAEGKPVALVRHPREAGIVNRLVGDLLEVDEALTDDDWRAFAGRLEEVGELAGETPLLVLDQFEDVLRSGPEAQRARAVIGTLLAATAREREGSSRPLCRWLLAYRQEAHGKVIAWLGDVLAEARELAVDHHGEKRDRARVELAELPSDLADSERFHRFALVPLATVPSGPGALAAATRVFQAAIEKPLALADSQGRPRYTWHFAPGHADRLARAFAEARLARPRAPLGPELQVVLAHLLARSGTDGEVSVSEDPGPLIATALEDHLREALDEAYPASGSAIGRTRALLALRELATATGERREEGLGAQELARAMDPGGRLEDGMEILEKLAMPQTRLVVAQEAEEELPRRETRGGLRWVLSHDRLAEVVVKVVEEEGRQGGLVVERELLALRQVVDVRSALFSSGEAQATRLSRQHFRGVARHAEALLWDTMRRDWWQACRRRRRADRARVTSWSMGAVVLLALVVFGVWTETARRAERRALLEQVAQGEPPAAFAALDRLRKEGVVDEDLLESLRAREVPSRVLEEGLEGLDGEERSQAVLATVSLLLPLVEKNPDDFVRIGNLVWALDFAPGRDPAFAEQARELRDRVLAPLRELRPSPPLPGAEDPDWIDIPAGSFLMGTGPDEEGFAAERPQHEVTVSTFRMQRHEVTNAEYRRLVPDHDPDAVENLPAAFVSWHAAYTYAAWLGGRLPSEAEWEYAARADCPFAYCTRDGLEATVDDVAWTLRNSKDRETGELAVSPVMQLEPNSWGLYDMLGNLGEWTTDGYVKYPHNPRHDPWVPLPSGGWRVSRGGGFRNKAAWSRVASRDGTAPGIKDDIHGLRAVLPGRRPSGRPELQTFGF